MTCSSCSQPVPAGSQFCPSCGQPTSVPDAATSDSSLPTVAGQPVSGESHSHRSDHGPRFLPGQTIAGRFRIVTLVGRGGMGEVYRADDLKLGQTVALKFLPESLEKDPDRLSRFLKEVRMARSVTHPNVCRVHDVFEADGQHFLSMEFVEGENLSSLFRQIGRVTQGRAVEVAHQICAGLSAAHEEGILHRDLKPANIMIDSRGRIRITDFGLAGLAEDFKGGEISAGTPAYMSPEQLTGQEVTPQSDIYALGLVLFELFTGHPPFKADSIADLKRMRLESQPSLPSSLHEGLDPTVETVILRCLQPDPGKRPRSARAVQSALPGGDPLGAALAAGETPSPEMVAEAGSAESWAPIKAVLLAVAALIIYFAGMYFQGTLTLSAYLPMDKPPQVLIDRATEIIAQLGYEEPVYSQPADSAFGFFAWSEDLREITASESQADRLNQIRQRPDLLAFWYRQSPSILSPKTDSGPLSQNPITLANPAEETPGNIEVLLDGEGRLRRFRHTPKRFSSEEPVPANPDWEEVFGLAGLDLNRFQPARPRYQRFLQSDERWAWVGTREDRPELEWRVEAGTIEGRIALFNVAIASTMEAMAKDPEPAQTPWMYVLLAYTSQFLLLGLFAVAVYLARRNWLRDRCDKRGALRLALGVATLLALTQILQSPSLFKLFGLTQIWPLLSGSVFAGMFAWTCYLAAEPYGRRVWPQLFVSSCRLLSRQRVRFRDPQVGQSVLIGVLGGAIVAMIYPLSHLIPYWIWGTLTPLLQPAWAAMVSQRSSLALVLQFLSGSMMNALLPALMLVAFLQLAHRKRVALLLTLIAWPITHIMMAQSFWIPTVIFCWLALALLMRFGFLSFVILLFVDQTYLTATTDFTAWHSQPSQFAAIFVLGLVVYGVWASTAGRKLFDDAIGET